MQDILIFVELSIQLKDKLLKVNSFQFDSPHVFNLFVKSHPPETKLNLVVGRQNLERSIEVPLTDISSLFSIMGELELSPPHDQRHTHWLHHQDHLETATNALIKQITVREPIANLQFEFQQGLEQYSADCRLATIDFGLRYPLKNAQISDEIANSVLSVESLTEMVTITSRYIDSSFESALTPKTNKNDPLQLLLLNNLFTSQNLIEKAFSDLSTAEKRKLITTAPQLLEALENSVAMEPKDSVDLMLWEDAVRLGKRIRIQTLAKATANLTEIVEENRIDQLKRWLTSLPELSADHNPPGVMGPLLLARKTSLGWILIGGNANNVYTSDAVAIIDIGGDDVYRGSALATGTIGETKQSRSAVKIIVDFSGNDHYFGDDFASIAGAVGGIGVIVDIKGRDTYQGGRLSQGAALCGVGILHDLNGDDVYVGNAFSQGAALFGLGILSDRSGSDRYTAPRFAQGFGSTRGFGLLRDDHGNDSYFADNSAPSSYGTPDVYDGWSQGVGCGIRGFSSGGLGVLVDGNGDDRYQAGNFSQGAGYFFSLGTLIDVEGNDHFNASRYAQGAAAHQAIGTLIDRSGNDYYRGRVAASQAGAWDMAVAILEDRSGNDKYEAEGFAQAAGAMTAVAILHDWDGDDRYDAISGQAHGDSRPYCGSQGEKNLAVLIDSGGGRDAYTIGGRKNSVKTVFGNIGLFSDQ